jgi:hypothetical protein
MLFILSVVVLTLASYLFIYSFWYYADVFEMKELTTKATINTAIPVKKLIPKYLKRNTKEKIKTNGNFAIEAKYSDISESF